MDLCAGWNQHSSPAAALLNVYELNILGTSKCIEYTVDFFLPEFRVLVDDDSSGCIAGMLPLVDREAAHP